MPARRGRLPETTGNMRLSVARSSLTWRRLLRPDVIYVLVCVGLILAWVVPTDLNVTVFLLVMTLMLPLSIQGYGITFFGGVLLFGPEDPGLLARLCILVLWIGIAVGNMLLMRGLLRNVRQSRAAKRARTKRPVG